MDSPYLRGSVLESPVGLVLTEDRGRANAMTGSFFSEVAHYPTALWVSIATHSLTHELIESSRRFSLAVLHAGQKEIAEWCGSDSGRSKDKCARLNLYRVADAFLYLAGSLSSISCEVRSSHQLDGHTMYVAAMLAGETDSNSSVRRHLLTADFR